MKYLRIWNIYIWKLITLIEFEKFPLQAFWNIKSKYFLPLNLTAIDGLCWVDWDTHKHTYTQLSSKLALFSTQVLTHHRFISPPLHIQQWDSILQNMNALTSYDMIMIRKHSTPQFPPISFLFSFSYLKSFYFISI